MSDTSTKHFPPSETKLEQLRQEGEIPRSAGLVLPCLLTGLACWVTVVPEIFLSTFEKAYESVWSESSLLISTELTALLSAGLFALFSLCGVLAVAVVFAILLETKFYFHLFRQRAFRTRRFSSSRRLMLTGGATLIAFVGFLFFAGTLVPDSIEQAIIEQAPMNDSGPSGLVRVLFAPGRQMLFLAAAFALFAGSVEVIWERVQFRRRHGMTRGELELEARENSVRPEVRSAQQSSATSDDQSRSGAIHGR